MIRITEKYTYDYVMHGVFVCVASFILTSIHVLFLFVLPIGILLVILSSGVEIDTDKKKIRKFNSIWSLRVGKWYKLSDVKKVTLKFY